ncbi:MAG: hypothetical protein Q9196_002888 [Gyalolechia fulgens]
MSKLREIRELLFTHKKEAAGQRKKFLPKESLDQILHRENISESLRDSSFRIQPHKFMSTVDLVFQEGKRVFAILVETKLESAFVDLVEHRILDRALPVSEERLEHILDNSTDRQQFVERQWSYLAYDFPRIQYVQRLSVDYVLPYVEQIEIEGGGFSRVYKVHVHPTHQNIEDESQVKSSGLHLFRKEIERVNPKFNPKDELELLFLLKHRNIVELRAAYVHGGIYNLLFPLAVTDLDKFLLQENRVVGFEADRVTFKAIHGLSDGLKYLHNIEPSPNSFYGVHQDIKPKNVLVRGTDFILADFGLSRLRPVEESSQTTWKDATFEYGAPECRDGITWAQGQIGRASDIWSLSCIISELMIYICDGSEGVEEFRSGRLTQDRYGKQDAFHDGKCLKEQVSNALAEVERKANSSAISTLLELVKEMFAEHPKDRPNAKQVEIRLESMVLQRLIQEMLDAITKLQEIDVPDCQESLRMESTRFRAWAGAFGFIPLNQQMIYPTLQVTTLFIGLCNAFENAIKSLGSLHLSGTDENNGDLSLITIRQCNNTIYDLLPKTLRARADGITHILLIVDASPPFLSAVSQATVPGHENASRIAAIKYMSSLVSQQPGDFGSGTTIKYSQIKEDTYPDNFDVCPKVYWYNVDYSQDQQQRVLVEWKDYGRDLDEDMEHKESQKRVAAMLRRIQGLVSLLQKAQSSNLRVLECLGTIQDPEEPRFGIVYRFPEKHSNPLRLHYLLKGGGSKGLRPPHIGLKFTLAKIIAACLKDVHLSGWVHKDLSSYNILFFKSANQITGEEYMMPYLVGFQYSREDETDAYTSGPNTSNETRKYQHPDYQDGTKAFRREFDYYSLGLVLLEIGVWDSLRSVYNRQLTSSPSQFRQECIGICGRQLLERMGPVYSEVTMTCLRAEDHFSGKEVDVAIEFQRLVIDKLDSCRV